MQAVHLAGSIFYALKILPARGTRPNKNNKKKWVRIHEKSDSRECKTNWECRKS